MAATDRAILRLKSFTALCGIQSHSPIHRPSPETPVRCQHCGKLTVVHTAGKGDEFTLRCTHCRGYHKFTKTGLHGSGAVNYRVTKVESAPATERSEGSSNRVRAVRSSTGGSQ